jgi:cyclophilin family peptidyl-prolyl cis-trans isomerase
MRTVGWLLPLLAACDADDSDTSADTSDTSDTSDSGDTDTGPAETIVDFETSLGPFAVRLDETSAPITAANFLVYVDEGFFDGDDGLGETVFHRVIDGFVVQGGGYTPDGTRKNTHDPIELESDNGLSNLRGTIAMARTSSPDSATSQFYVNHVDNAFLDYVDSASPGYAVFGEVIEGIDAIDAIAATPTDGSDAPITDVVVTSCERR